MKPQYLKHHEIDKVKWDASVAQSINHLPYCFSWYLDIVSPAWNALVLDDYDFIFPLTHRTKAGINYLYQPYFTQQLGLFGKKNFNGSLVKEFVEAIPTKFKFIEINLNTNCVLNAEEKSVTLKRTHLLNLNESFETVTRNFSDNTKRNIKKASSENFTLEENNEVKKLIKLFQSTAGKKTELKKKDYEMLGQLIETAMEKNSGKIFLVKNNSSEWQAAMFLLRSKNCFINLFNASSESGKKNRAMFFLMNEILRMNSNSDFTFDFEGSEIPEVARFYKGFGGKEIFYPHLKINHLHWSLKWIKE